MKHQYNQECLLLEQDVRKVINAALQSSMAVPQAAWSREFVEEAVLTEIAVSSSSSSDGNQGPGAGATSTSRPQPSDSLAHETNTASSSKDTSASDAEIDACHAAGRRKPQEVVLTPQAFNLAQQFLTHEAAPQQTGSEALQQRSKNSRKVSGKASRGDQGGDSHGSDDGSAALAGLPDVRLQIHSTFSQLLQDNYQEVTDADVAVFGSKLLQGLARLLESSTVIEDEDSLQGLCQLCERDMPLTKHHLIPRDVHKDFKKRGHTSEELQAGVLVCRPCHSAIHRAVPDNKQLGMCYRTLDTIKQHPEITKFVSWARRQRVTSKADVNSAHFRYRR